MSRFGGLMDDSVAKVDVGSALVGEAGKTMEEIVSGVERVADIIGEITAASPPCAHRGSCPRQDSA